MTPPAMHEIAGSSRWIACYPAHEPREHDPHHKLFTAARNLLISRGTGCWRCGSMEHLEAHHCLVEWALINGIDVNDIAKDFPAITDVESLHAWAEGPDNLEILCRDCHRGPMGVHLIPYPLWVAQRWAADNTQFLRRPS